MPSISSQLPPRTPTFAAGLALFFAVVALGLAAAVALPEDAVLFATPALILLATGLAVFVFRVDAKETLLLRLPSATDLLMAIPLAMSFFILDDQIAGISHARFPISEETQESFRRLLTASGPWDWVEKIGLIGIGAAVSEELMFRGFIQSAMTQRLRRSGAILITAVLFMLLHVQFLPVLAAGVILGFVAAATRSIVIPIFVHFANNATQLLLFNLAGLETLGDPIWIPPTILVPALVMFALTWGYYMRRLEPEEPEKTSETESAIESERPKPDRGPIEIQHTPPPISRELASLPPSRRRLGWLVVAAAVSGGLLVLGILFLWSVYAIDPQGVHSRGIELLQRQTVEALEPAAQSKQPQLTSAFEALSALNDTGQMSWRDLAGVARSYGELGSDGGLDAHDADVFISRIRELVLNKTRPRAL